MVLIRVALRVALRMLVKYKSPGMDVKLAVGAEQSHAGSDLCGIMRGEALTMADRPRSTGITLLSLFFVFGATMSSIAAIMLLFPGSPLEPLWRLNPHAHEVFAGMGTWAVLMMMVVCAACVTAALGLWRCTRWGWWTAVAILGINLVGDTANAFLAQDWRTLIGLPIGGFMIAYLLRRRSQFGRRRGTRPPFADLHHLY